jgi:hypothetical protein
MQSEHLQIAGIGLYRYANPLCGPSSRMFSEDSSTINIIIWKCYPLKRQMIPNLAQDRRWLYEWLIHLLHENAGFN